MPHPEVLFSVRRRVRFAAIRELGGGGLDPEASARLHGREQGLHGHDYTLYVTVAGRPSPSTGMVLDLKALSDLLKAEIVSPLAGGRMDQSPLLGGWPATAENLAMAIWRRLEGQLPSGRLSEVELWEGPEKCVRYRGE